MNKNNPKTTLRPKLTDKQKVKILRAELRALMSDIEQYGYVELSKGGTKYNAIQNTLDDTEL